MVFLTRCTACQGNVTPENVVKSVVIPAAPMHIALVYKCPRCGKRERVVAETEEWKRLAELSQAITKTNDKQLSIHIQVELGAISTAQDLMDLWAAQKEPPLLEDKMGACRCDQCNWRMYGKKDN